MVHMVMSLTNQSLLSGYKFAESGYMSIFDGNEVNIYYGRNATIIMSEDAFLKGWRCPGTKLPRIPLRDQFTYLNMYNLPLNGPMGR